MFHYKHFALDNLWLANGYQELSTSEGPAVSFELEDDLERCVARLVLRMPKRIRGWDLRFLRRQLGMSQADFGVMVERDAQTVARWEKAGTEIPRFCDLTIRTLFAARFNTTMTVSELQQCVDLKSKPLPAKVILVLSNGTWNFQAADTIVFRRIADMSLSNFLPRGFDFDVAAYGVIYQTRSMTGPRADPTVDLPTASKVVSSRTLTTSSNGKIEATIN